MSGVGLVPPPLSSPFLNADWLPVSLSQIISENDNLNYFLREKLNFTLNFAQEREKNEEFSILESGEKKTQILI